jgi:hypothetical protein
MFSPHSVTHMPSKSDLTTLGFRICWSDQILVAHVCHPVYTADWDQVDHGSRSAWPKVHKTPSQPIAGHGDTHLSSQGTHVGGWDWEDHGSRPTGKKKKSSWDPISMEKVGCGSMHLSSQWPTENHSLDQPGQKVRPYLQNNQGQKGWRCGSSSPAPALQTQSPKSNTHTNIATHTHTHKSLSCQVLFLPDYMTKKGTLPISACSSSTCLPVVVPSDSFHIARGHRHRWVCDGLTLHGEDSLHMSCKQPCLGGPQYLYVLKC